MKPYISAIIYTIFYSIPYFIICDIAMNLLQFPFALIHRYAARLVFIYKVYIACQFFAIFAKTYVSEVGLNPIILLAIYSVMLFYSYSGAVRDAKNDIPYNRKGNVAFLAWTATLSVPALWLIYYFDITLLNQPATWLLYVIYRIFGIPVLGNILKFILNAITGMSLFFIIPIGLFLAIALPYKLIELIREKTGKHTDATTESITPYTPNDAPSQNDIEIIRPTAINFPKDDDAESR